MPALTGPLSGRKAQAARNDATILDAARAVFLRDPAAPIADVAAEAGVGVSALYRRYASKEVLLQTLCADGLQRFIAIADAALADGLDPWDAFAAFIRGVVESDVHSLTVRLAGTFTPTPHLHALADEANKRAARVFRRARSARVVRADVHLNDLAMLFEQLAAVRVPDAERTRTLRERYLALHLDALRMSAATTRLPGPPPGADAAYFLSGLARLRSMLVSVSTSPTASKARFRRPSVVYRSTPTSLKRAIRDKLRGLEYLPYMFKVRAKA